MKTVILKRICLLSFFCIAISAFALQVPVTCYGEEYSLDFEFSPNIVNIESEREGEIRILTRMRYSFFTANKSENPLYIYFNDSEDSVENIRATRDSLGNLILKFHLEDLLAVESDLMKNAYNTAEVVIIMSNGDEYSGTGEIYIADKGSPSGH